MPQKLPAQGERERERLVYYGTRGALVPQKLPAQGEREGERLVYVLVYVEREREKVRIHVRYEGVLLCRRTASAGPEREREVRIHVKEGTLCYKLSSQGKGRLEYMWGKGQ